MRQLAALLLAAALVRAGGGPETTLVVVNAASPVSKRVANEYVRLRGIPEGHVVHLDGIPHLGVVPLDFFREHVWKPIRAHIEEHGLEVELIAYSADFPYGVSFRELLGEGKPPQIVGGIASLTGVTYLARQVEAGEEFWRLDINDYYRITADRPRRPTAEEQRHFARANAAQQARRYAEAAAAYAKFFETYDDAVPLPRYNHACCLALLGREEEALRELGLAVDDGFNNAEHARNDPDLARLRNKPRFAELLERMAAYTPGLRPTEGFRPGAYVLCTQLAYTGPYGNSVPEVLRYLRAAAASDGTKPDGTVYVCKNGNVRTTAREAFFPALVGKLESLGRKVAVLDQGADAIVPQGRSDVIGAVVGTAVFDWEKSGSTILPGAFCDHLTSHGGNFGTKGQTKLTAFLRNGAAGATGTVTEPLSHHYKFPNPLVHFFYAQGCSLAEAVYQSVYGPYQLMVCGDGLARPFAEFDDSGVAAPPSPWTGTVKVEADELWVDGRRVPLELDTGTLADGHHDVRLVAIADDPIRTRTSRRLDVVVRRAPSEASAPAEVRYGESFRVAGADRVLHDGRVVSTTGEVRTTDLGPGPVTLVPVVGGARARPLRVDVRPPEPAAPPDAPDRPRKPGLRGTLDGGPVVLSDPGGKRQGKALELAGELEAPADGFYQLVVTGRGRLTLEVGGATLCEKAPLEAALFLPVALRKGWHPARILLEGGARVEIGMGGDQVLAPPAFRHWTLPALASQPKTEGEDLRVPGEGLVLTWKRTVKDVAGVTLYPAKGEGPFPRDWTVESRGSSGKWKPVKDLAAAAPEGERPAFVELTFEPVRARQLRLRAGAAAELARLQVLGKGG